MNHGQEDIVKVIYMNLLVLLGVYSILFCLLMIFFKFMICNKTMKHFNILVRTCVCRIHLSSSICSLSDVYKYKLANPLKITIKNSVRRGPIYFYQALLLR